MAMVNMNNLLNGKDSRWLQLEVCREFQRNKCSRPDTECKFAHPPANVEVQNGRVTACYDSIKGRCNRDKPPCKYFHPPQHLKDQLLINGRNHLALKNALIQQMGLTPGQPIVPGQVPTAVAATTPYLAGVPQVGSTFSPYFSPGPIMPLTVAPDPTAPLSVVQQTAVVTQQKLPRTDRLEGGASVGAIALQQRKRAHDPADDLILMDMKSVGSFYYENFGFPNMVPYKRTAGDKSGVPVYQPASATYQQLLQPFVPVSCEYRPSPATTAAAFTGVALNKMISHHQYLTAAPSHSTSHFSLVRPPPIPPTPLISDIIAAQYSSSLNNNNDDELQPYKKMKTT
ncbi:protein muscleblind isoform X2 [Cimex lectularius]|uniref:C3H1-type domain-containing protein n=1 Tax=Cimex lectularius TaxID=79782 RepID=A0A8I6RN45_CIMLE|nr:protein muscleblind isoform X2 [Cimex lectularius]